LRDRQKEGDEKVPIEQKVNEEYSQAVASGHYDLFRGGLSGKHDNVRRYWEDQLRNAMLGPHLLRMVERKKRDGERIRIADLGCGTGQGLELLTSAIRKEQDLGLHRVRVLRREMIAEYAGCDLCEAMVAQAREIYQDWDNVFFHKGDFSTGFPLRGARPFDIYFSSYGSLSHIDDEAMERLFIDIVEHSDKRSFFIADWLGRFSIEWPKYWDTPAGQTQDYAMSWLPGKNHSGPIEQFPMRFWSGEEIRELVSRVQQLTGDKVRILNLYDGSLFVGRHVDTGEYNESLKPLRRAVNRLHEDNVRTDLSTLHAGFYPVPGHDDLNGFFSRLRYCWNALVGFCERRLRTRVDPVKIKDWRSFPAPLQTAILTMDRVIDAVAWMRMGDPRANIIEPQLGYSLRNLEIELQAGRGCGHAIVGIFEIIKDGVS